MAAPERTDGPQKPLTGPTTSETNWYALSRTTSSPGWGSTPSAGSTPTRCSGGSRSTGANEIATEPPPTLWAVAKGQLANPMNIMLLIVSIASFAIGQVATGVIVLALVSFNVIMGTNQERKALASVEALAQLQVPKARVRRSGSVEEVDSTGLVPGDIVLIEAGDLVPADARIVTVGVAGGAGGVADRRERADRQGRHDAPRGRDGARRPDEPRLPEHPGDPGLGDRRRGRHRRSRPRWVTSPTWSRRRSARSRRCSGSSTA